MYLGGIYFTYFKKVYKNKGITIHVPFELTDFKFRGRFVFNSYEEEEARHLSNHLDPLSKVLELGACLGYVSCLTNRRLKDNTQHVVVEANPKLMPWIERNKEQNGCGFHLENVIISKYGDNDFYVHDLIVGGSSKRATEQKIKVKGVDFEHLIGKYDIEFDTLIMDIEGGELELLRNFGDDIRKFEQIFIELHPFANILTKQEAEECENILCSLGFEINVRDGNFQIWKKHSRSG